MFNEYFLSSYYVPGIILGSEDSVRKNSLYILMRKTDNREIEYTGCWEMESAVERT